MLRLRSSSQMAEVNTHGAEGGGCWLRPSVCVRAISSRRRRGRNPQRDQKLKHWRVTTGCVREADRQTYRSTFRQVDSVLQTENYYTWLLLRSMESIRTLFLVRLSSFCEVAIGVGGSDERTESAPTQTAPPQGFGSYRDSAVYRYSLVDRHVSRGKPAPPPTTHSRCHVIYRFFSDMSLQPVPSFTAVEICKSWVSTTHRSYSQLTFFISKCS